MPHGDPNYNTFYLPPSRIEDTYKPRGGWPRDAFTGHPNHVDYRDNYVDVTDLEYCDIPPQIEPGVYGVNALGWIINRKGSLDPQTGQRRWRRLTGTVSPEGDGAGGYRRIGLVHYGEFTTVSRGRNIHNLVIEAFGDREGVDHALKPFQLHHPVHHKDHNRKNNHILNLKYVSVCENVKHTQIQLHSGTRRRVRNKTGQTGVCFTGGVWLCQLRFHGDRYMKRFGKRRYRHLYQSPVDQREIPDEVMRWIRDKRRELGLVLDNDDNHEEYDSSSSSSSEEDDDGSSSSSSSSSSEEEEVDGSSSSSEEDDPSSSSSEEEEDDDDDDGDEDDFDDDDDEEEEQDIDHFHDHDDDDKEEEVRTSDNDRMGGDIDNKEEAESVGVDDDLQPPSLGIGVWAPPPGDLPSSSSLSSKRSRKRSRSREGGVVIKETSSEWDGFRIVVTRTG